MKDQVLTYREMCNAEKAETLQRGMNYRLNPQYSVILMSQRSNAPYKDRIHEDGITIEYEGHDVPKVDSNLNPKHIDQSQTTKNGKLTQNGLFVQAIEDLKSSNREPELVKIYEKILPGIWSEKGFFRLMDYKIVDDEKRKVFRFILEEASINLSDENGTQLKSRTRVIPTQVKKIVWDRDEGKCVICGATDELHFDHDLPYSLGGTSVSAKNVKLLCERHNLSKSNKIE